MHGVSGDRIVNDEADNSSVSSESLALGRSDETILVLRVRTLALSIADDEVGLLVNFLIVRVEWLVKVVVEDTGLSIVLHGDLDKLTNILRWHGQSLLSHVTGRAESGSVIDALLFSLGLDANDETEKKEGEHFFFV